MRILLIGAPGSGKGTQAKILKDRFQVPHISTGEILRKAVAEKTALGTQAKGYMDRGELVPDSVIVGLLEEVLQGRDYQKGYILDGYPRNIFQAKKFDALVEKLGQKIDFVFYFFIPFELLEQRITGRRVSEKTGREYHILFHPPKVAGICDVDGSLLVQRPDDQPEKVKTRLEVYKKETEPVIQHYREKNKVVEIDSRFSVEEVFKQIEKIIQ